MEKRKSGYPNNNNSMILIKLCAFVLIGFAGYYTFSLLHILVNIVAPRYHYLKPLGKLWPAYIEISFIVIGFGALIILFCVSGVRVYRLQERYRKIAIILTGLNITIIFRAWQNITFAKIAIISMSIVVYLILFSKRIRGKFKV